MSRRLDRGDVNFVHCHHRLERTLCGRPVRIGRRFYQYARCNLPGQAPFVLAPPACPLSATIADDGVPVTIGLDLVLGEDLNEKASLCLKAGPPFRPRQAMPTTLNSTVSTWPCLPAG